MADHYLRSIERLEEAADLREQLDAVYALPGQHDRQRLAALHQRIGFVLKQSEIHAQLAVSQELSEIATSLQYQGIRP